MENLKQTTKETLQIYILEGRKIILKKLDEKQKVQIRFNHWDTDGTRKWRVIVDGVEFHTSEIVITTNSRTESEYFENLNEYKHHIIVDANQVEFNKNIANIS